MLLWSLRWLRVGLLGGLASGHPHRALELLRHQGACVGGIRDCSRGESLFEPVRVIPERPALTTTRLIEFVSVNFVVLLGRCHIVR